MSNPSKEYYIWDHKYQYSFWVPNNIENSLPSISKHLDLKDEQQRSNEQRQVYGSFSDQAYDDVDNRDDWEY